MRFGLYGGGSIIGSDNTKGACARAIVAAHDIARERSGQFNAWRTAVVMKP
jgi:hypothetical protein